MSVILRELKNQEIINYQKTHEICVTHFSNEYVM
jgi:hypothetical protein